MGNENTRMLKTHRNELVKQYVVYDGQGRPTDNYEARADTKVGTPCLRTRLLYDGTSNRVTHRLEVEDVWQVGFDGTYP